MDNPEVDDLVDLLGVAEALLIDQEGLSSAKRVEALLELAISDYALDADDADPAKNQDVSQLWFGLKPCTCKLSQKERHERAAQRAGVKVDSFEAHNATKIKNFLAGRIATRYADHLAQQEELVGDMPPSHNAPPLISKAVTPTPLTERTTQAVHNRPATRKLTKWLSDLARLLPRWAQLTAGGAFLLAGALGFYAYTHQEESPPPTGSIVNAISGVVESHPLIRKATAKSQIFPEFRACNISAPTSCAHNNDRQLIPGHSGDTIGFEAELTNTGKELLPYARIKVSADEKPELSQIDVYLDIYWPSRIKYGTGHSPTQAIHVKVPTATKFSTLAYVPGSTLLLNRAGHTLTRLPDGIMGLNGIALTDIGAPKSCFECNEGYVRFIVFTARVEQTRH